MLTFRVARQAVQRCWARSTAAPSALRHMARSARKRPSPPTPRHSPVIQEALDEFNATITGKRLSVPLGRVLFKPLIGGAAITAAGFVGAAYYEKDWHIYQHIANKVTADYILKLVDHGANVTAHQAFFAVRHGLLKPGEFDIYVFLGVCGMVFLAWQLPRFHHFMMRNFVHSPIKGSIRTMFTSTLSHASIPHLLFNGIAMYTIGLSVYHRVGPAEFWAFCTGAAVFSSIGSVLHMLVARRAMAGLGASGVIMGLLAMSAFLNPDGRYSIILLPFFDFSGVQALAGVMTLDVVGLLLGWSTFGHAAHLGGALFGLFYFFEGQHVYDSLRSYFHKTSKEERR